MTSSRNVSFAAVAPVNISISTGTESRLGAMTASGGRASTNNRKGGFFETGNVSGKNRSAFSGNQRGGQADHGVGESEKAEKCGD